MEPEGASATAASGPPEGTIKPISKGVAHRICAGQVILDLSSAVKELVENSLDAAATSIEVSLRDYGLESFQVIDNGCGISPRNFKVLALKHHTSKLSDFPDLLSLATFGFRGEALSSLCALGDLTVETRTVNEPVATHLTYDHCGLLIAERKTARQVGTTVMVKKLFSGLPVRSKEFARNIRKEYGKLITLLNAYALIAKGVRLVCTNTTGKSSRSVVLKTQGGGSLKDNIIAVFGASTFSCLEPVNVSISEGCIIDGFISKSEHGSGRNLGDRQYFFVNGRPVDMPKFSKLVNELYRGANSKQYPIAIVNFMLPAKECDVNVTPDKRKIFFADESSILMSLRRALEMIYSPNHASYSVNELEELGQKKLTSVVPYQNERLHLPVKELPQVAIDEENFRGEEPSKDVGVVLSTDKEVATVSPIAEMIGRDDVSYISTSKDFSMKFHTANKNESICGSSKTDQNIIKTDRRTLFHRITENRNIDRVNSGGNACVVQSSLAKFVTVNKRKHEKISTTLSEVPVLRNGTALGESSENTHATQSTSLIESLTANAFDEVKNAEPEHFKCSSVVRASTEKGAMVSTADKESCEGMVLLDRAFPVHDPISTASTSDKVQNLTEDLSGASSLQSSGIVLDSPMASSGRKVGSTLQFSIKDLMARRQQRLSRLQFMNNTSGRMKTKRGYVAATLDLSQLVNEEGKARALAAASTELERIFKKEDFTQMKVIGQFNLGFIVGKLDDDLFIVDQHAADEKYNYERLSESTILNQQPLLRPLKVELSPEEEIVVSMHMDIIRKNGFLLEEDEHAPPGNRFNLKAVPFSKNITFGTADVKELISILADGQGECSVIGTYRTDAADSVCPPRVRAMLASRACRSSVMIGDPLGRTEMQKILRHLANLKSPWNCPHGRPTMRHLVDLTTLVRGEETL